MRSKDRSEPKAILPSEKRDRAAGAGGSIDRTRNAVVEPAEAQPGKVKPRLSHLSPVEAYVESGDLNGPVRRVDSPLATASLRIAREMKPSLETGC